MKRDLWLRLRADRLIFICGGVIVYILLAFVDAKQTFSYHGTFSTFSLPIWVSFGFSLFVALIFFAVGSLVWFYSRDRWVASLLFLFSCFEMVAFELETASLRSTQQVSAAADIASAVAITLFAALLLVFPKNHLTSSSAIPIGVRDRGTFLRVSSLRVYIFLLMVALCFALASESSKFVTYHPLLFTWLDTMALFSNIFTLTGSLITLVVSFHKSTTREREQLRFFVSGVILALTPLLLLTIIPQTISTLAQYSVDAEITTLTVILLPISLGYSILRYQILVFDSYIRRAVHRIIGSIFLAILAYVLYIVSTRLIGTISFSIGVMILLLAMAVCAPTTWWLAKVITERVLFKESLFSRQLIDGPIKRGSDVLDVGNVGQRITEAALQTFKTTQVGLFILLEETGCYHLLPGLQDTQKDDPRRVIASRIASSLSTVGSTLDIVALQPAIEERLSNARRPLLLHEVMREQEKRPIDLSRYLTSFSPHEQNTTLVAPVRSQGRMIALFVLGERADQQSYAGPDFEVVEHFLARYSSLLNTARLQEHSRQHTAKLHALSVLERGESSDSEHAAHAFAKIAAQATGAGVEIWIYDEKVLRQRASVGVTTHVFSSANIQVTADDWLPYYSTGQGTHPRQSGFTATPPCFPYRPEFSFAWLPLKEREKQIGILFLTYSQPHIFLAEERCVLEMFAERCVHTLEYARIEAERRAAYEHTKDLDALKEQFLRVSSQEVRTPLLTIQEMITGRIHAHHEREEMVISSLQLLDTLKAVLRHHPR